MAGWVAPAISVGTGLLSGLLGNKQQNRQNELNEKEIELRRFLGTRDLDLKARQVGLDEGKQRQSMASTAKLTPAKLALMRQFFARLGLDMPELGVPDQTKLPGYKAPAARPPVNNAALARMGLG